MAIVQYIGLRSFRLLIKLGTGLKRQPALDKINDAINDDALLEPSPCHVTT